MYGPAWTALLIFAVSCQCYDMVIMDNWYGALYNITLLQNNASDYEYVDPTSQTSAWLNIGRPLLTSNCGPGAALCLRASNGSSFGLGAYKDARLFTQGLTGLRILLTKTDWVCDSSLAPWIDLKCTPDGGKGKPIPSTPDLCRWEWQTQFACPLGECMYGASCENCTTCPSGKCKFCLETKTCVPESDPCQSFVRQHDYCPDILHCEQYSTCDQCTSPGNVGKCFWCLDSTAKHQCSVLPATAPCSNPVMKEQYCPTL